MLHGHGIHRLSGGIAMRIYLISTRDKGGFSFMPELTASRYAAEFRKQMLEEEGYTVDISRYEVKTQGPNFNSISLTSLRTIKIG